MRCRHLACRLLTLASSHGSRHNKDGGHPMKSLGKLLAAIVMVGTMGSASATLLSFGINLSGGVTLNPAGDIQAGTTQKTINPNGTTSSCTGDAGACVAAAIPAGGGTPGVFSVSVLPT